MAVRRGLVVVVVFMWWLYRLSRDVIRGVNGLEDRDNALTTLHPIFNPKEAPGRIQGRCNGVVRADPDRERSSRQSQFDEAVKSRRFSEDAARQMLTATEAIVRAEKAWYLHSLMIDANLLVASGKGSREEALAMATKKIELTDKPFDLDEIKLRDKWKTRLEDASAPGRLPQ